MDEEKFVYARFKIKLSYQAEVAELADAHGSGPCPARGVGSSPTFGTTSDVIAAFDGHLF